MPAARATIRCSPRCGCTCAMRHACLRRGALAVAGRARCAGGARRRHGAARLHPHAAGDAEHGGAVGAGLRRRDTRRREGLAQPAAHRARIRWARRPATARRICRLDREATRGAGLCRHAGTGDRGAALARQGRGAAAVRDHAAHAGHGRLAADLLLFYTQEFGFVACRMPSPPAPRSCRRSATPMCSS
jgi:hypothetical protein